MYRKSGNVNTLAFRYKSSELHTWHLSAQKTVRDILLSTSPDKHTNSTQCVYTRRGIMTNVGVWKRCLCVWGDRRRVCVDNCKESSRGISNLETSLFKLLKLRQKQQITGNRAKERKNERKKEWKKENHANTLTIRIWKHCSKSPLHRGSTSK